MKIAALYSGGKDSTFALSWAKEQGWEVCGLITMLSKNPHSYMFHTPNIWTVKLQAECLGLPVIFHETEGVKEEELEDLKVLLKKAKDKWGIDGITTGAVNSVYQKERIGKLCDDLGLSCHNPLWEKDQEKVVTDMISSGFKITIQAIAADGMTPDLLGKVIDSNILGKLKKLHETHHIHIAGEGGEYESLILDCPVFKKKIEVISAHVEMDTSCSGVWVIDDAKVVDK